MARRLPALVAICLTYANAENPHQASLQSTSITLEPPEHRKSGKGQKNPAETAGDTSADAIPLFTDQPALLLKATTVPPALRLSRQSAQPCIIRRRSGRYCA